MKKYQALFLLTAVYITFCAGCGQIEETKRQENSNLPEPPTSVISENKKPAEDERQTNSDIPHTSDNSTDINTNIDTSIDSPSEISLTDEKPSLINPAGSTLAARISEPDGFQRKEAKTGSLLEFLRNYSMKPDKSPVLLYDGTPKNNQNDHIAVFELPIENEDLQQCADSVMRVYAEYFWNTKQYDRIAFHFTNGFLAEYLKWQNGLRIQVNENQTTWASAAGYDDSYENFQKYLRIVFSYAGTLSMDTESEEIQIDEIKAGDVFLEGGSPGHVVMLADICENDKGEKAFLLAQGYMPAQEFHVLKNPRHENDPWYYEDEVAYPFLTPEYTFEEGSLRRLHY